MKVCIIGGGGQVAEALGTLLRQNDIDMFFYRPDRIIVPGVPVRPHRPNKQFEKITIDSTRLTVIEKASFRYNWFDELKMIACDVFIFAMPSYLAEPIAKKLAKYLTGRVLVNMSDRFLGTYAMNREIIRAGFPGARLAIAFNSPPLISYQPIRNEKTKVYYDKSSVYISCYPKGKVVEAQNIVSDLLGLPELNIKIASNMLELAFENTQSIIHAVQDLENLKRGKYGENGFGSRYDSDIYTDEMVARVNKIVKERDAVSLFYFDRKFRNVFDYDASSNKNFKMGLSIEYGTAQYRQEHTILRSVPRPSIYYAHGYEDVGWSMVPLESMAHIAKINTPYLSSLIDEWCSFMHNNYRKNGRTVYSMGLCENSEEKSPIIKNWSWSCDIL